MSRETLHRGVADDLENFPDVMAVARSQDEGAYLLRPLDSASKAQQQCGETVMNITENSLR